MGKKKITIYGERLKAEAQKRGYKNDDMADLLSYSSGKQISPIYSGTQALSDDRFALLSKEWGLREEYLRNLDDWETDSDMWAAIHDSNIEEYRKSVEYLKTIGLLLDPNIYWQTTKRGLYYDFHDLEDYITEKGKQYVNSIIDFSKPEDEAHIYPDEEYTEYIEMKALPPDDNRWVDDMIDPSNITKESDAMGYSASVDKTFNLMFKVTYNNNYIGMMSLYHVRTFLKHIDALCTASIQSLVLAGDFLPIE